MAFIRRYDSPLGGITLASDGEALTGLWFDDPKALDGKSPRAQTEATLPVFDAATRWLDLYFSGVAPDFTPKLRLTGTAYQHMVWQQVLKIPYGRTASYADIASALGLAPFSARAIGRAVGRNPVLLIVPCHRVVGVDGSLTGYAAGLDKKARLLELEAGALAIRGQTHYNKGKEKTEKG